MASKKNAPEFSLTLFEIYKKKKPDGPLPESPIFTWTDRNGTSQQIPFLQPVQITSDDEEGKGKGSVKSATACITLPGRFSRQGLSLEPCRKSCLTS